MSFNNLFFEKDKLNIIPFFNFLNNIFGCLIKSFFLKDFEIELQIYKNYLVPTINILKYSCLFLYRVLIDISIVDHPQKKYRFFIFYQLLSDIYTNRCRILTQTDDSISSIFKIYPNACWAEREAWDMFGVFFNFNYDLRRILTDYGFEDFPLQKTFKLTGTYEVSYNETVKRVVYQNITISQKYREFTFSNPWGANNIRE